MPYANQEQRRAWYARSPDARRKASLNSKNYRHKSPEARERWRQWKRNKRAKNGAVPRVISAAHKQDRLAEQNARQAWQWWLKNAPDLWLVAYYESIGKPWSNPRLTISEAYRLRYAMDVDFYHREYARLQAKKVRQRSVLGCRAGGMSAAEVRFIRESETNCYLCDTHLPDIRQRTIDHVIPLAKGGLHVRENVRVACRSCNSIKGDREMPKVLPGRPAHG